MALAYAMKAEENDYRLQHYPILKKWTTYLVQDALYPASQISTDDFAGLMANQTNLALKGIIGIQAMAVISDRTAHPNDASKYLGVAEDYIAKWQTLSIAHNTNTPHTMLSYGANEAMVGSLRKACMCLQDVHQGNSVTVLRQKYGTNATV